mgnify:FL=1
MLNESTGDIMSEKEKIKIFLNENHNYIMTKDIINLGIDKKSIPKMIEDGEIKKVNHGIYMSPNVMEDEYYIIQLRYPDAIFSYNTAFHIMNMTNLTPSKIDVTTLRKKQIIGNYNVHYVSEEKYNIGIVTTESPFGNPIKIYNAERCICDMLKSNDEFDLELQNRILNNYFNSKEKNIKLLEEYAKKLNVYDKVNTIIEVIMKW